MESAPQYLLWMSGMFTLIPFFFGGLALLAERIGRHERLPSTRSREAPAHAHPAGHAHQGSSA